MQQMRAMIRHAPGQAVRADLMTIAARDDLASR